MPHNGIRALTGLVTVAVIVAIVAVAVGLFQGSFSETTPVTVLSPRAGLVMNPDAKVKMHGVQVGKVASIESRPNGQAVLHLAMYPSEMHLIPANVLVDLTSPTVFGAKFVELVPPAEPSAQSLHAGQVLDSQHVTVEINTVFQHLTSVLGTLDPAKLNETLGAIGQALSGRGEKIGQAFSDLDSFLAKFDPTLPALSHDIAVSAPVINAYADAAPDLVKTVANSARISQTFVDEQHNLDALLISAIGLANVGNDVLSANRKGLTDVIHLLRPTTDLTNEYNKALWCGFAGLGDAWRSLRRCRNRASISLQVSPGGPNVIGTRLTCPRSRRRAVRSVWTFRSVRSTPMRSLSSQISVPTRWQYGNQQLLLNFDGLKQLLYGPIDGPPRNPAQVGQQG